MYITNKSLTFILLTLNLNKKHMTYSFLGQRASDVEWSLMELYMGQLSIIHTTGLNHGQCMLSHRINYTNFQLCFIVLDMYRWLTELIRVIWCSESIWNDDIWLKKTQYMGLYIPVPTKFCDIVWLILDVWQYLVMYHQVVLIHHLKWPVSIK